VSSFAIRLRIKSYSTTVRTSKTLPNKNGLNTGDVTKTMTAQIPVIPTLTQPLNNRAWNYVYATHPVTPGACDMTIQQSVVVASPLFVDGILYGVHKMPVAW